MKQIKYLDANGRETAKDKAVMVIVSVYDDDGKFVRESIGQLDADADTEVR